MTRNEIKNNQNNQKNQNENFIRNKLEHKRMVR